MALGAVRGGHGPLLVDERGAAPRAADCLDIFKLQDPVVFERRDRTACRAAGGARERGEGGLLCNHGHGGAPPTMRGLTLPTGLGVANLVSLPS